MNQSVISAVTTIDVEQFKDCYFMRISLSAWGNRAKIRDAEAHKAYLAMRDGTIEDYNAIEWEEYKRGERPAPAALSGAGDYIRARGNGAPAAADRTSATKTLLQSKAIEALTEYMTAVKDSWTGDTRGRANKSRIMDGLFTVKKSLVPVAESELKDASRKIARELRPAIVEEWESAIEKARTAKVRDGGLGPLFDSRDYPDADTAARKYGIRWQYLKLGVPDDLPAELRAEKEAEFTRQLSDAAEEIKQALRVGFAELISHATEKLTVAPGEKPKVFRDTLIGNIDDFISSFAARNMGDSELAALVDKARAVIRPNGGELIDPDRLRKFANVRDQVQTQFAEVAKALDGMIVERKSRRIDVSED